MHERSRLNIVGCPFPWQPDLLFVVYVEISDDKVHIVSARHATKHERNRYEERT